MSDIGLRILEAIQGLHTRVEEIESRLGARIAKIEATTSSTLQHVADLDNRVSAFPDMHYLAAAAKTNLGRTRQTLEEIADLKIKMDEIYGAMATNSEIQGLRADVTRFREESLDREVRLATVEGHLGLSSAGP